MNRVRQAWDFVFGAMVIGTLPLAALLLVAYLGVGFGPGWLVPLAPGASILVAVAILFFVIHWRKRHRKLPVNFLWAEVLGGILLAIACCAEIGHLFYRLGP